MEIFDGRYFVIHKTLLQLVGVWPNLSPITKACRIGFFGITTMFMIVSQILAIFSLDITIDELFERLSFMMFFFVAMIKLISFILATNKMKMVYSIIVSNWKMITDENEQNILKQYSEQGRLICLVYTIYVMQAATAFILIPMATHLLDQSGKRSWMFIYDGKLFVDKQLHYYKIYAYEAIQTYISCMIICAIDVNFMTTVEHALGLFTVVKYRLKTFTKHAQRRNVNKLNKDVAYEVFVEIIKLHGKTLQFLDLLESSFNLAFLFIIGVNLLCITVISILIIIYLHHDNFEVFRYSMVWVGVMIHLFFISWPGQKIVSHSLDLFESSYNNEWYNCSLKIQRALKVFTLRCSKPCTLTAGGLYVLNFPNFLTIVKSAMSYITVFLSFR